MTSAKIRIGMVGTGFIAEWHLRGFSALPAAEIVGLTRDFHGDAGAVAAQKRTLEDQCAKHGLTMYESYDAMAADPSLDALIIGSINPYHYSQIISGLQAGKHLLVEKPVVTDPSQIDEIERLSRGSGRVVFPAHNFVYRGAVAKAKEILECGTIGRIIQSSFVSTHTISEAHASGWRGKKQLGTGGSLIDSGHHLVYQSLYLLGMPQSVQAFTSKLVLTQMECEDVAQLNMQYADGSVCCLMQSWASDHGEGINGIRILGAKGNLVLTDALYLNGERIHTEVDYPSSFVRQAEAFVDAVRGGAAPASTMADVRATLKIIFGAYDSAARGSVVTFA